MIEGLNDKILKRMTDLNNRSIARIRSNLKGTAPFAAKPIPPEDLIYAKNTIGYMDLKDLNREYGRDAINKLLYDITLMENRRVKSGTVKEKPIQSPIKTTVEEPQRGFPIQEEETKIPFS